MDALAWSKLQSILAAVIDTPAPQRESLLDSLCGDDTQLRHKIEALLACEGDLPEQLPAATWMALADEEPQPTRIGERAGPFEIESRLGEGGSSVVYAARRVTDFSQRVAIKLLRSHVGAAMATRFALEREMLSRLNHPNIAKLFDAGELVDATPYLVLELVEGRNWSQWLAEENPSKNERLAKFLSVCDAVEHAHQHLLVHRDIKPSNIMIDGDGRAKLLDFGIAKLLDGVPLGTLTREGGFVLTPSYAAPEQLRGELVTTATDVFALGVVLYETLTGERPHKRGSNADVAQLALDSTVPCQRPSLVRPTLDHALAGKSLRGDLENIVMKALEPELSRRYASVTAFADDLRAYRDGRPVTARARSWHYVAGKFVRRHPLGTLMAVLASIAIGVSLTVAVQEAQRARRHLGEARALAHDILIDYPEKIAELPGSLPIQSRMVQDAMRYLDSLREVAGADAELSRELASGYLKIGDIQGNPYRGNLGDSSGAEASYRQAALALEHWQRLAPDAAGAQLFKARLASRMAAIDHQQTELDNAAIGFRSALSAFAALDDGERDIATVLEHADTLDFYGDLLGNSGQTSLLDVPAGVRSHAAAKQLRLDAMTRFPNDHAVGFAYALSLEREGDDRFMARDLDAAQSAYRAAIERIEALLAQSPGHVGMRSELAAMQARLTQVLEMNGDLGAATITAKQSVVMIESLLAADPTNDHYRQGAGAGLGILAKLLIRQQQFAAAAPFIDRQIAVNQRRLDTSPNNGEMALALSLGYRRRGEQLMGQGDFAGAIEAHTKALQLQTRFAQESADFESHRALTLLHLGRAEARNGARQSAEDRLQQATTAMTVLVTAHPDIAVFREDLIDAEEALGDVVEVASAGAHYRRAIELIDAPGVDVAIAPAYVDRRRALVDKAAFRPRPQ